MGREKGGCLGGGHEEEEEEDCLLVVALLVVVVEVEVLASLFEAAYSLDAQKSCKWKC